MDELLDSRESIYFINTITKGKDTLRFKREAKSDKELTQMLVHNGTHYTGIKISRTKNERTFSQHYDLSKNDIKILIKFLQDQL